MNGRHFKLPCRAPEAHDQNARQCTRHRWFAVNERRLRMGVAGLGRAFTLMLPTLAADPRIELVAAADPRPEATRAFAADFGARAYATVEDAVRRPGRRRRLRRDAASASRRARRAGRAPRQARAGREADGDHARGMPRHDRRGRAGAGVPDRRPQPQFRSADRAHATDHRQRRVRRGAHDPGALLYRFPLPSAAPGGTATPSAAAASSSARVRTRSTSSACSAAAACAAFAR